MITKINKFALLLLMLCFTVSVSAASEAEYKKLAKTWKLNADGSQEFHYNMELTLFTHAAMNSKYGESFIVYNPKYQTLKINESYTRQKNGTIVKTPANAFVEVLPKNAADAPAYNELKEMVIVHTGLELGATIYLDYTLTSKPGYLPEIDVFEAIQQSSPIREYTLSLITPAHKMLNYTLANTTAKPSVKEGNGERHTSWTLRNVPQVSTSAYVSIENGDLPYLAVTTYASTKEALKSLNEQMNPTVNSEIQKLAAKFKGQQSEKEQIKAIIGYVNHSFSANNLTLKQTGYRLRPVSEVLASAYGTEAEKANLLTALLKAAGFKAEVIAGYPVNVEKGLGLDAINHLYVAVNGQEYILAMNTLNQPKHLAYPHTLLFKVNDGSDMTVAPRKYQINNNQTLSVQKDKFTTVTKESLGSSLLPYFAEKSSEKVANHNLQTENGYATIVLGESKFAFSTLGFNHLNSSRKVNLLLPRPVEETYTYSINCGNHVQLCTPSSKKEIHNAAGHLVISIQKEGRTATVTRSLKLNKQVYTPSEYKALRLLLSTWSDTNTRTLLFSVE